MTTNDHQAEQKNHFRTLFEASERSMNGRRELPIHQLRRAALEEMTTKPFPTRRDEDWKYTSVNKVISERYQEGRFVELSDEQFDALGLPENNAIRFVFMNGQLDEKRSFQGDLPQGLHLSSTENEYDAPGRRTTIDDLLQTDAAAAGSAFVNLNRAFSKNGTFLSTERNAQIAEPIHFLFLATASETPVLTNPQLLVEVASGSSLSIIEEYRFLDADAVYFNNAVTRARVATNAHLHHYRIQFDAPKAYHINHTTVHQSRDSSYSHYNSDLGANIVRNTLEATQGGENCTTNLYGTYLGRDRQHLDTQSFLDHAMPHCESNELYKGILTDRARGVFNGKVIVRQDAQKINAFQQNSSLVLSDTAQMDSKPQLEIFADDVRCSHGATIGQLDEPSVFYLRSRGLSDAQARSLLQFAFVKEVVENYRNESVMEYVVGLIEGVLEEI